MENITHACTVCNCLNYEGTGEFCFASTCKHPKGKHVTVRDGVRTDFTRLTDLSKALDRSQASALSSTLTDATAYRQFVLQNFSNILSRLDRLDRLVNQERAGCRSLPINEDTSPFETFPKESKKVAQQYVDGAITALEAVQWFTNFIQDLQDKSDAAEWDRRMKAKEKR